LEGDASIYLIQEKPPFIREGEGTIARKDFYHKFLTINFFSIHEKIPNRINPSLIDLLLKQNIGEYFILEEYSYVRVCGSKFPPKALPKYTSFSFICLDIVR